MKRFLNNLIPGSIYLRFLLTILVIGTLPVAATGMTVVWMNQHSLTEQSSRELIGLARGFVGQVETYFNDALIKSRILAVLPDLQSDDLAAQEALLQATYLQDYTFTRLTLYRTDGSVQASSDRNTGRIDPMISSFVQASVNHKQAWQLRHTTQGPSEIMIFTPVAPSRTAPSGAPRMVLQTIIPLTSIAAEINREPISGEGMVFIVDQQGMIVVHANLALIGNTAPNNLLNELGQFQVAGPGTLRYENNAEPHIAGYAPSSYLGWVVFVDRPERVVVAPVAQTSQLAAGLIVFSMLLATLGAMIATRQLTRPLQQLVRAVQAFGRGDTSLPLPTAETRDHDIRTLIVAVAEMRSAISAALADEQAARKLNQAILASVPSALFVVDPDLTIRSSNQAAHELFGADDSVLHGQAIEALFATDHLTDRMHEVISNSAAQHNILLQQELTGQQRLLRLAFSAVNRDSDQSPAHLLVMAEDLTELVAVQQRNSELQSLQAISKAVLSTHALPDLLQAILNQTLGIMHAHLGCIYLFNAVGDIEESACTNAADPLYHELIEQFSEPVIASISHQHAAHVFEIIPQRLVNLPQGGALISIPIVADQRPLGVMAICIAGQRWFQIHELRLLETIGGQIGLAVQKSRLYEAIYRSEERFRQIAEQINDVFWIAEPGRGGVLYISPAYAVIWDRSPEELYTNPWRILRSIPAEDRPAVASALRSMDRLPQVIEHRIVRPDGSVRWILSRTVPVYQANQQAYRIVGSSEDITARKQAEDALRHANAELIRANAELARAVRMKDEFLATMSHELRTPLNAILGRSEVLSEEIHGPLSEGQRRSLRSIDESGRHLLSLINDILDLSKIEAGKLDLSAEPISVVPLINAAMRMVSQTALNKQISLHSEIDPGSGVLIGDERRLKQMIVNLLSNAIKFTPPGGSVGIEVHPNPHRHAMRISVWDTGIGIAADDLARLFRPFVQLDSRLSRDHGGTGLGLALVARMAALHGGSVEVASTLGEGSSFTLHLPWEPVGLAPVSPPNGFNGLAEWGITTGEQPPSVMIAVGDEPPKLPADLEQHGWNVTIVRSGIEVVASLRKARADVLVLDRQIPQLDALRILAILRNDGDLAQIPIVVITNLILHGDEARCLNAGADRYLTMPIVPAQLRALLAELTSNIRREVA